MLSSAPVRSEGIWPLWRVRPHPCRLICSSGPLDLFIFGLFSTVTIFGSNFEVSLQIAAEGGSSEMNLFPLENFKTFFPLTCYLPHHGTDI